MIKSIVLSIKKKVVQKPLVFFLYKNICVFFANSLSFDFNFKTEIVGMHAPSFFLPRL